MKKQLLVMFISLIFYQAFIPGVGQAVAQTTAQDTLSWTWEVSSTVSTRTKTCTLEFSENLMVNWGDGVTEWIPDSMSARPLTHVYAVQANYRCTAVAAGISYFKADSKRLLELEAGKAPGLTYLSCSSNQLAVLDLKKNTKLISLYVGGNNLKALDLSRNAQLQTLTCSDNELMELDVSMLSELKKVTCHTNPLQKIRVHSTGALSYLSCSACELSAAGLDSVFNALPILATVSGSKNLYVLNNPGSSSCRSEIAAAKNWTLDRVLTQSSLYVPSVTCKVADSAVVKVCLKNTAPVMAFEWDVQVPEGFVFDTGRSRLSSARKGEHTLSIARKSADVYKIMAYSLKSKDVFTGTDGAVLDLYFKAPSETKTYTLDIQNALLIDTLTNVMDVSVTDGQLTVSEMALAGDANRDEKVDVTDLVNLVAWINGIRTATVDSVAVDMDGNGLWNVADVAKLVVVINTGETVYKSAPYREASAEKALSLYRPVGAPSGNHLFIRQATDDATCLELCLDNVDAVQAFQADVSLPQEMAIQTGSFVEETGRNKGHRLSITEVSPHCYRLLSYSPRPQDAFSGNTGVLTRLQLLGMDSVASGTYPIRMKQSVLTGMHLSTVASTPYDVVVEVGRASESGFVFGSNGAAQLWVQGIDLRELWVWDVSGRLVCRKSFEGVTYYGVPLQRGIYLARADSDRQQGAVQKVVVY